LSRANISIPIKIGIISNHIHLVTGNEVLCPKKALVLGLCGVIPKEFPGIKCFNVDLYSDELEYNSNQEIAEKLAAEFDEADGTILAYRGKFRWIKEYNKINLHSDNEDSGSRGQKMLKENGVYLITGGTGGIGLTIAKYLAEEFHARLLLTQLSEMPPKINWRNIVKGNHIDNILSQKISKLIEIEESGGVVNVFTAPVSDKIKMKEIINSALNDYGEINGIIHCAGIVSPGIISAKEKETIEKVFLPKVEGTLVLNELITDLKLDFFAMCSSITSVITPFAESDYSAANAFIDVYAQYSNSFNKVHTISINWPGWKEVGQLANLEMLKGTEQWKKTALEKAISPHEGLEAFKLALNSDFDQIIVSPGSLESSDPMHSVPETENIASQNNIKDEKPGETESTNVEENLSLIWKEILGVMKTDNDDNFFEAGGHSLLAIQLISAIRKTFQVDLSIEDVLDAATFSAICKKIYELRAMNKLMK
jgi:NAD(P)-dependent dehydrogenase (short-subunit alcohol dehydrogenase family)/acyl carrier protein